MDAQKARPVFQAAKRNCAVSAVATSLDPGVGKTQAVIYSVRELLRSKRHGHIGVIFFLGRLAEIKTIVDEIGLPKEEFAVLVANSSENSHLNSLGNPDRDRAKVLFTTQQMLQSRSRGKKFAEAEEFHFLGRARQVRIWDEEILPARPICVNVTLIEAMTNVFRKHRRRLFDEINALIARVEAAKDREVVEVPDFEKIHDVDTDYVWELFNGEKRELRDAATNLWLISGKTASVRTESGNNTILDYEETWPSDLLPILVLDASGRVRHTYRQRQPQA